MKTLTHIITLARPKTLIASISPVLLAAAYALHKACFNFFYFSLLLMAALMLQIVANITNDYCDGIKGVDTYERVGPLRLTGSGLISLKKMKQILIFSFILTLFLGLILSYYGGPLIASVFGIALIAAILYSASPFALSHVGIAEPFAFAFFGPIPTLLASFMFAGSLSLWPFLLGCLPGLYSLILLTINNLRDYESDKYVGKKTLIVKKGKLFGKKMIQAALIAQVLITIALSFEQPKLLLTLIILPETVLFYNKVKKSQTPQEFAPLLKECTKIYAAATVLWVCFTMI